jgi:hypothetical protein
VQYGGTKTSEWAFVSTAAETANKGFPSVYSRTNNASWAKDILPGSKPGETFVSATAITNKDILAFSAVPNGTGREWQFNGSTWMVIKAFNAPIGGASVTSASNVWVFGSPSAGPRLGVYHYNGRTWTKVASTLVDAQASGSAAVGHYVRSVKRFGVTDLPGSILSIARVDRTFELAGGSIASGKANPATYAELEFYN